MKGTKVEITEIEFIGNHAFSATRARKQHGDQDLQQAAELAHGMGLARSEETAGGRRSADRILLRQRLPQRADCAAADNAQRQQDHDHRDYRRRHALPRRPHQYHGQFEVSAPRAAPAADVEVRAIVPRLQSPAPGAGAVGFLLEPRLRLRQRRSAHAVGADHQARQRHLRDQSRPRSADRPHQYQRQHQDLRQGYPPRNPGAGAGALQRRRDPRFEGAAGPARFLQQTRASRPRRPRSPTRSIWT